MIKIIFYFNFSESVIYLRLIVSKILLLEVEQFILLLSKKRFSPKAIKSELDDLKLKVYFCTINNVRQCKCRNPLQNCRWLSFA